MSAIDIKDVQRKIAEMLEAVERGETLAITRDGKAVAMLEPASKQEKRQLPSLAEFRASLKIDQACSANSVVELRELERY